MRNLIANFLAKFRAGREHYITSFDDALALPIEVTDRKCPGCGAYAEPWSAGHGPNCPYSAEKNGVTYGRHAR